MCPSSAIVETHWFLQPEHRRDRFNYQLVQSPLVSPSPPQIAKSMSAAGLTGELKPKDKRRLTLYIHTYDVLTVSGLFAKTDSEITGLYQWQSV